MPDQWDDVAAQLWCKPQHGHKVMDVAFAESIAAALRQAVAETVPRRFVDLIPDGESDFDQCEKCGGIFPDEVIRPISAGPEHQHWCRFCICRYSITAVKEAVAEQREADAKIAEAGAGEYYEIASARAIAAAIRKGGPG